MALSHLYTLFVALLAAVIHAQADNGALTQATSAANPSFSTTVATHPAGVECFHDDTEYSGLTLSDCYRAIGSSRMYTDEEFFTPVQWYTRGRGSEGVELPAVWSDPACYMVVDTAQVGGGQAELTFVGATYFATLVVNSCFKGQKIPLGGRFWMKEGGFYVAVSSRAPLGWVDTGKPAVVLSGSNKTQLTSF